MGKVIFNVVLPTKVKMFCDCLIEGETLFTCPVCRGEKGAYPILNKKAVEEAIALVLALRGKINQYTLFDRVIEEDSMYRRISQYSYPVGTEGSVTWTLGEEEAKIEIPVMRMKELEEECGIPALEIVSGPIEEEQNPYYIEEIEKILTALGMEEWEIIETDEVIETMEVTKPLSYLPDPDIPPVIISQWWIDQIAAKYPDLIHIEQPEVEEEDDF